MNIKLVFAILVVCCLSFLVSIALTIAIHPFWAWFESKTGIESYGHSGPALWCYLVDFVGSLTLLVFLYFKKSPSFIKSI